MKNIGY